MGLGDEEVDDWPGNELPPAVLPDFDEVGFPRHQLLDLPSRVLLVRYRANGFIERSEGSALRHGEPTRRQIHRRIGSRMSPELIAQGPRDLSAVCAHAEDGNNAVVGEALQILEELRAREVRRRGREILPVPQVGVRFDDTGHDRRALQIDPDDSLRGLQLTASAHRREPAILHKKRRVFDGCPRPIGFA